MSAIVHATAYGDLVPYIPDSVRRRAAVMKLGHRLQYALTCSRVAFESDSELLGLDYKLELAKLAGALGASAQQTARIADVADEVAQAIVSGDMERARPHLLAHRRLGWGKYSDVYVGVFREMLAAELNPRITAADRRRCWH